MNPLLEYVFQNDEGFRKPFLPMCKFFQRNKDRAINDGITEDVASKLNTMTLIWSRPNMKSEYIETISHVLNRLNNNEEITDETELAYIRSGMLCFAYNELDEKFFIDLAQAVTRYQLTNDGALNIGANYWEVNLETRGRRRIDNSELIEILMTYYETRNLTQTGRRCGDRDNKTIKEHLATAIGVDGYDQVKSIFDKEGRDELFERDTWGLIVKAHGIWSTKEKK